MRVRPCFAFVVAILVAGAPRIVLAQAPPRIVSVSDPQNGGSLTVFAGDTVKVRLHSNPSTGYSWQVTQVNKQVLEQQGESDFESPPKNIPGAIGHSVFRFLAAATGTTTLQLAYTRPWEKDKPPVRVFSLEVTVQPASERPLPQP